MPEIISTGIMGDCSCCGSGTGGECPGTCQCGSAIQNALDTTTLTATVTFTTNTCNGITGTSSPAAIIEDVWPTPPYTSEFDALICGGTTGRHLLTTMSFASRSITLDLYCPCNGECPNEWKYAIGDECMGIIGSVSFTCDPLMAEIPFTIVCAEPACTITGTITILG
jgi:hypothetical protein